MMKKLLLQEKYELRARDGGVPPYTSRSATYDLRRIFKEAEKVGLHLTKLYRFPLEPLEPTTPELCPAEFDVIFGVSGNACCDGLSKHYLLVIHPLASGVRVSKNDGGRAVLKKFGEVFSPLFVCEGDDSSNLTGFYNGFLVDENIIKDGARQFNWKILESWWNKT